jgi:cytochrome c2
MRKYSLIAGLVFVLAMVLAACGGGGDTASESGGGDAASVTGNPARGEKLYAQTTIGSAGAPGCVTCHSLEADVVLVGPSHAGVGTRAGAYVAGMSAEEYLRESVVEPDAHVVDGYTPGMMYQNYAEELNVQEIADLVVYLQTLK